MKFLVDNALSPVMAEDLQKAGILVGAVLNRVDFEHNAYYDQHYYRREYGAYRARSPRA